MTEVRELLSAYSRYRHFYVVNDRILLPHDMEGRTYFIRHSERDLLFFMNLFEAWQILRKERPNVILSTGASPAVPFAVVGRLFGARCIYVESLARMTAPSLTGRIMYWLADRFFYQSQALAKSFPKGEYGGSLI